MHWVIWNYADKTNKQRKKKLIQSTEVQNRREMKDRMRYLPLTRSLVVSSPSRLEMKCHFLGTGALHKVFSTLWPLQSYNFKALKHHHGAGGT